jgi:acetolactate synthase small subunit
LVFIKLEEKAKQTINQLIEAGGWRVQDIGELNLEVQIAL